MEHGHTNAMKRTENDSLQIFEDIWDEVLCPGITPSAREIEQHKRSLARMFAAFRYKKAHRLLWAVFMGGTGTGKSTLFNALIQRDISTAGVERPKTEGPIVYVHEKNSIEDEFPFPEFHILRIGEDEAIRDDHGTSDKFTVVEHNRNEMDHLVLVDTPDLDSLEMHNRQIAEDISLLADVVVFVTSQEKYADEVPSQSFHRIYRQEKPYFFLLNKVDTRLSREDVLTFFHDQGIEIYGDHFQFIPYVSLPTSKEILNNREFSQFAAIFSQTVGRDHYLQLIGREEEKTARNLSNTIDHLLGLLGDENKAANEWRKDLETIFEESNRTLLKQLGSRDDMSSRAYIQQEIRKIFNKYDLLRKPRRYIAGLLMLPLRLLGLKKTKSPEELHTEELLKARRRVDISPITGIIERFNRLVLERLSPRDEESSLYKAIRKRGVAFTGEEIREKISKEQEELAFWVERTFQEFADGISKSKELGIYSTSILWGVIIVSFEIVLGGGISILEATLDSILAPFVTKGSVELFASREVRKIAHDLDLRYRNGLIAILREQTDRYASCLDSLVTANETMEMLRSIQAKLEG